MTAHRAPSPVTAGVADTAYGDVLTAAAPQGPRYVNHLLPPSPPAGALLAGPAPLTPAAAAQTVATCAFRALPESVRAGREFTRSTLREWGMATLSDLAELVVSELVTNALRHGVPSARTIAQECPIRLRLLAQVPFVMCMVTDPGAEIPILRDPGPAAESGRGLNVVESCSVRWGWHLLDEGGKVVWALLRPQS
jgi:anti-sigma regulatory factor (Ser/Thr protein kinase)